MRISKSKIEELAAPIVEAMGYCTWHIDLNQAKRGSLLRIYIDRLPNGEAKGVSLDDCGKISSQIGAVLDVEDPFSGSYTLEVSSPGIDRSLYELEHYQKYIGGEIKISLFKPVNGKKSFVGKLLNVNGNQISLLVGEENINLELTDISKAKLMASF